MKTIVVATNFSPSALNATNYATEMALVLNANIFLLHVYQIPVAYSEVPIIFSEEHIRYGIKEKLIDLKQQLTQKTRGTINIDIQVRFGSFFPELEKVCEHIMPYAVVVGSPGTTAAERLLFGDHIVSAMKHLMWPIITVPPNTSFSPVRKIGLACNLKQVINTIPLEEINILVNDFNAKVHVVNIDNQGVFKPETAYQSVLLLKMMAPLNPTYHFIANKNTDESIMDFAERNRIDLLIVLPRQRALLKRLIHKSHTTHLTLQCHVPVMALHQCNLSKFNFYESIKDQRKSA